MHLDLRRRFEARISMKHLAFLINLADIFRSHESLGNACRCAKECMIIQLYGNVSIVRCNHVAVVDSLSDVADLFLNFKLINSHLLLPP